MIGYKVLTKQGLRGPFKKSSIIKAITSAMLPLKARLLELETGRYIIAADLVGESVDSRSKPEPEQPEAPKAKKRKVKKPKAEAPAPEPKPEPAPAPAEPAPLAFVPEPEARPAPTAPVPGLRREVRLPKPRKPLIAPAESAETDELVLS